MMFFIFLHAKFLGHSDEIKPVALIHTFACPCDKMFIFDKASL